MTLFKFNRAFIVAVAKGEKLDEIKQLTPSQALELGLLVKQFEAKQKK
jgi:hypothetical protein